MRQEEAQFYSSKIYTCAYWKEEYDEKKGSKFKINDSKALKDEERKKKCLFKLNPIKI